jgi:hypothetical protein
MMTKEGEKDMEGSGRRLFLMQYPDIYLEGLRKTIKTSVRIAGLWSRTEPGTS